MTGLLESIGAFLILWGMLWYLWDKFADAPAYLLGVGLLSLLAGAML
jgi:hypothetical protein